MQFLECASDKLLYPVASHTMNKIAGLKDARLHDVLEQSMGYNFVFHYTFYDGDGEEVTGYKTIWQDREPGEMEATVDAIMAEHSIDKDFPTELFNKDFETND